MREQQIVNLEKKNLYNAPMFRKIWSILIAILLVFYIALTIFLCALSSKFFFPQASSGFLFVRPIATSGECDISDFTLIYASGLLNQQRLKKYHNLDVYDPFLLTQTVGRIVAPMLPIEVYSIQYLPMLYALTTPLSYLSIYHAWLVSCAITVVCIIATFFFIAGDLCKVQPRYILGLFPCFTNVPFLHLLMVGQTAAIETAILGLSFRFLLKNNHFWAGFIAGAALFKIQFVPIILIPGICLGKLRFMYGYILMCALEGILSIYVVGWNNILNFLRVNYLCEMAHTYVGLNDPWTMMNFRGALASAPVVIQNLDLISIGFYVFFCLASIVLWLKVYPVLKKINKNSFGLIASITIIPLVIFALHCYLYDYVLMIMPCLWLYQWATREDRNQSIALRSLKSVIALMIICIPIMSWLDLFITSTECTLFYSGIRIICTCILLLCLVSIAVILELHTRKPTSPAI